MHGLIEGLAARLAQDRVHQSSKVTEITQGDRLLTDSGQWCEAEHARPSIAVPEQGMRLQSAEQRGALAHPVGAGQTNLPVKFHGMDLHALPAMIARRAKWPVFTPPAAGLSRRYRGRLLHRRSHAG